MKYALTLIALAMAASAGSAQTILQEDFETGNTGSAPRPIAAGSGWTTIDSYKGSNSRYSWHNYYSDPSSESGSAISGACCAEVDAPLSTTATDGAGPREEILLTPELTLDNTYQLQFTFVVSPVNHQANSQYDLQVRVVSGENIAGAETIFSIQNEKMLRESGISVFPIDNWSPYTASVDLSDFRGEKVRLAFVYKMNTKMANVARIDDVIVKQFTPPTGPVASLSLDRFTFPEMYIGEKMYSDPITLTNTGKDGLTITGIDLPDGVTTTLRPEGVNLLSHQSVMFNLAYSAALTSATSGKVVLHTSGGDAEIEINASKKFLPDGASLETFEGYFPPAGWTNNGWGWTSNALEGDHSAYQSGDISSTWIQSPRLDLLDGGKVTFTYYNSFDTEYEGTAPYNDVTLQLSVDNGKTWVTKWTADYQNGLNKILTQTVDLGTGSDQCYIRWHYPAVETSDEGADPHSIFYLDRVMLPKVFGSDGVPQAAEKPVPAIGANDIYPEEVTLSWAPAQFAEGYKLYVGTTSACNELVNGIDLGNVLTYTLHDLKCETQYRWRVIPYNSKGDCASPSTWTFTTQKDETIQTFPYEQNFEDKNYIPTGWVSTPSEGQYKRTFSINSLFPYTDDNKTYNVAASMWLETGQQCDLITPKVVLPTEMPVAISFIWGDGHPSDLKVDPTGMVEKNNVSPNNGVSEMVFQIQPAGGEWTTLSTLSEDLIDNNYKYWHRESFNLATYAGQTVKFRWIHKSYSGRDAGGSVTHIVLDEAKADNAMLNKSSWAAGKVNYGMAANSGNIFTLFNTGSNELTIKSVKFEKPNFECSLKAGDKFAAGSATQFNIQYNALQTPGDVEDTMTVEFESGNTVSLPVSGTTMPETTYYYSFEPNDLDHKWTEDFTMIDVDKAPCYNFSSYWVHYSAGGTKCAFSCESDSKEDGMYGMMAPVSGMYALVGSSGEQINADNWIISKKLVAQADAAFDFYCRNWETINSVLPEGKHSVSVLVSTTGNTNTSDFTPVMEVTEIPYLNNYEWKHYDVDLSAYAGKAIHVALRHTTSSPSNLAFFDDFTLSGFKEIGSGIEDIEAGMNGITPETAVSVYNINGVCVASGKGASVIDNLPKGFYIVKADGIKAFRIFK